MKEVHMIVQGKGGVGKSLISTILAQYLKEQLPEENIHCFDTDPVNRTFHRYQALQTEMVDIMDEHNNINSICWWRVCTLGDCRFLWTIKLYLQRALFS